MKNEGENSNILCDGLLVSVYFPNQKEGDREVNQTQQHKLLHISMRLRHDNKQCREDGEEKEGNSLGAVVGGGSERADEKVNQHEDGVEDHKHCHHALWRKGGVWRGKQDT